MAVHTNANGHKKVRSKKGETLRFDLELKISARDDITNEFHYPRLVADKETKDPSAGDEPFQEDSDAKLAAIARRFEEKYAPKSKLKGGSTESDLIDRGYGYDIDDTFVDDSEAYEDYVPPTVDTEHGGFYINTGQLEFKKAGDFEGLELGVTKKKKMPKVKKQPSHHTPQAILASQKLKKAKQHVAAHKTPKQALFGKAGGSMFLKQVSKDKATAKKVKKEDTLSQSSNLSCVIEPSVPISIGSRNISLSVPIFEQSSSLAATGVGEPAPPRDSVIASSLPAAGLAAVADGKSPEGMEVASVVKQAPILPANLPADVLAKVKHLEEIIMRDQDPQGKLSTKTRLSYDDQLVDIEVACRCVPMKLRNAVFEYLAFKMGVLKITLLKRVKTYLRKKADEALELPLQKLREAVERSMPEQVAAYEEEVKERAESASSASDKPVEGEEDIKMEDGHEDSVFSGSAQAKEGASRPKSKPRKKYKWSNDTKELLYKVVKFKVHSEESINRINRGNGEEIIMQFLEEKVHPLWPKGWMQKQVLYRLTEHVHKHYTQPVVKKVKKEKTSVIKTEPTNSTSGSPKISTVISPLLSKQAKMSPSVIKASKDSAFSPVSLSSSTAIISSPSLTVAHSMPAVIKPPTNPMPTVSAKNIPPPKLKVVRDTNSAKLLHSANSANAVHSASSAKVVQGTKSPKLIQSTTSISTATLSSYLNLVSTVGGSQVVLLPPQVLSSASALLPTTLTRANTALKVTSPVIESSKALSNAVPFPVSSTATAKTKVHAASKYGSSIISSSKPVSSIVPIPVTTTPTAKSGSAKTTPSFLNPQPVIKLSKPVLVPSVPGPVFSSSATAVSNQQLSIRGSSSLQSPVVNSDVVKRLLSTKQDSKSAVLQKKPSPIFSPAFSSASTSPPEHSIGSESPLIHHRATTLPETVTRPNIVLFHQGNIKNTHTAASTVPVSTSTPGMTLSLSHPTTTAGVTAAGAGGNSVLDGGNGFSLTHQRRVSTASVAETSPLRSPVEQIFSEHSYGSLLAAHSLGGSSEQEPAMECTSEGDSEVVLFKSTLSAGLPTK